MQAKISPQRKFLHNTGYTQPMSRKLSKPRPPQASRLVALRSAAGLTQHELARLVGESQANIAFWERSEKPPRSDVLPKLAQVLGVSVVDLLVSDQTPVQLPPRPVPVLRGRMQEVFEKVSRLPRRQQEKIVEFVAVFVAQYEQRKQSGQLQDDPGV